MPVSLSLAPQCMVCPQTPREGSGTQSARVARGAAAYAAVRRRTKPHRVTRKADRRDGVRDQDEPRRCVGRRRLAPTDGEHKREVNTGE